MSQDQPARAAGHHWIRLRERAHERWLVGYCDGSDFLSWSIVGTDEEFSEEDEVLEIGPRLDPPPQPEGLP